jgi:hypothetical protein
MYAYAPCERSANTSATTRVHARVTSRREIPSACGAFVPAATRAYPRVPPQNLNGKEGVSGSSPEEGFTKRPANQAFRLSRQQTRVSCGHSRVIWRFARCSHAESDFGAGKPSEPPSDPLSQREVVSRTSGDAPFRLVT